MTAIFRSLQATGWEDEELRLFFSDYHQAWQSFLQDPEASELLLAPLGSVSADFQLDVAGLLTRWEVLGRNPLPKDVDLIAVARAYQRRLHKAGIVEEALRPLFLAKLAHDHTGYLEASRGFWPDFDLDQYARRVKERYRAMDLSALTPPARDDLQDRRIPLRDLFVPQHVREDQPPREVPKEIWSLLQIKDEGAERRVLFSLYSLVTPSLRSWFSLQLENGAVRP